MTQSTGYRDYPLTLAAGEEVVINRAGSYVACFQASAEFRVGFDGGPFAVMSQGIAFEGDTPWQTVRVSNPTQSTITLTLLIARGRIFDRRLAISGGLSVAVPGSWSTGAAVSVGAGATALVLAANSDRAEALICNDGGDPIYLRSDATAAPGGVVVAAGATAVLGHKGAIYAYNPSAAAVSVLPSEVT